MNTMTDAERAFIRTMRALRRGQRLQQQDMVDDLAAHGVRLHNSAISKIEAGNRPLRLSEAVAIAQVLGTTVDEMTEDS